MAEDELQKKIICLSVSKDWESAQFEWLLYEIYESQTPEKCLCGHSPITEVCMLQNKYKKIFVKVGVSCVKKFLHLPSESIFQAVKRIKKYESNSLNRDAINYALEKGLINTWEYDFCISTIKKKDLSRKQFETRIKVNKKILLNIIRNNV
ncbi:MAG: hypothetical protein HQK63_17435 [Desulfamplus sp.]|nr:hypothetical protein [Desulfamplus sp.]